MDKSNNLLSKEESKNMKLYRYMSLEEFIKMSNGLEIVSKDTCKKSKTTSDGICFLGEKTTFFVDKYGRGEKPQTEVTFIPEQCFQFLQTIVSEEILVEFEASEDIDVYRRKRSICKSNY